MAQLRMDQQRLLLLQLYTGDVFFDETEADTVATWVKKEKFLLFGELTD